MSAKLTAVFMLFAIAVSQKVNAQFILATVYGNSLPTRFTISSSLYSAKTKTRAGVISNMNLPANTEVKVRRLVGSNYEVKVTAIDPLNNAANDPSVNNILYVDRSELDLARTGGIPRLTAAYGAFSFPFKWRTQAHYFEPNFQLSGAAGVRVRLNAADDLGISFFGGAGFSNVKVDSTSADPISGIKQETDKGATTFSFSSLLQYDKAQISFSIGWDVLNDNRAIKWRYQGLPWITIGFGYNIFTKAS